MWCWATAITNPRWLKNTQKISRIIATLHEDDKHCTWFPFSKQISSLEKNPSEEKYLNNILFIIYIFLYCPSKTFLKQLNTILNKCNQHFTQLFYLQELNSKHNYILTTVCFYVVIIRWHTDGGSPEQERNGYIKSTHR